MDVPRLSQRESGLAQWLPSLTGIIAEIVFLLIPALLHLFPSISEGGIQGESPLPPEPGCYLSSLLLDFSSVQGSCSVMSDSWQPREPQHARPPCPSPTPGVHSNSCPSSRWCHPTISSSVVRFSSCRQSFPGSGSFQMNQSIGVSALASVLPMNTQDWSLSEWTGWISLQSKGLSRVFSNTTVQKH